MTRRPIPEALRETATCTRCDGKGWLLSVWPERRPRPAYWFQRGPNGERPHECDCQDRD